LLLSHAMAIEVFFWGSNPDNGNDDCHSSVSFESEAEALEFFRDPHNSKPLNKMLVWTAWLEIPDLGVSRCVKTDAEIAQMNAQKAHEAAQFERACLDEMAVHAGMIGGAHAFNEVMGFDTFDHDGWQDSDYFY